MKRALSCSALLLAASLAALGPARHTPAAQDPPADEAASSAPATPQDLFLAKRCNLCHSIDSLGIARKTKSEKVMGPDLSDVGSRHEAAWIVRFQKKEETLDGKQHPKAFAGSDEDLQTLAAWLTTLKTAKDD